MTKTSETAKSGKVSVAKTVNKIAELEAALRAARKAESDKSDALTVIKNRAADAMLRALLATAKAAHVDAIVLGAFRGDASGVTYGKRGKGGTKSPSATKALNVVDFAVTPPGKNAKEIRIGSGSLSKALMWVAINVDGRKDVSKPQDVYKTDSPVRHARKMAASLTKARLTGIDHDGKRVPLDTILATV